MKSCVCERRYFMKKKLPLITFLLLLALAIAVGVYRHFSSKTPLNDSYVNGNTAGNLYNTGLFCENGGTIFFSNPSDKNRLYSMDADGANLKKLSNDVATYINADEHYIYYVRNNLSDSSPFSFLNINTDSLCRIDKKGKETLVLDTEPSLYASLIGNYIYYLHYDKTDATSLYKVKIDGTELQQVDKNPYYTCAADGQYIYYNGLENDHNIWRLNTVSDSIDTVYLGNCWMPTVTDNSIAYFMDCDNGYKLAKVDLNSEEKVILCDDRIDCYNLSGSYIYFQRNNSPALCRIRTDGSDYTVIKEGIYSDINVITDSVYFRDFNSGQMYRADAENLSVEPFEPGIAE